MAICKVHTPDFKLGDVNLATKRGMSRSLGRP